MSVKKFLILCAAGLIAVSATAVLAGGPDMMAMPAEPAWQQSAYVDVHVGYAQSRWGSFAGGAFHVPSTGTVTSNEDGGFTAGADLGYNFARHLAVELGWFYLPRARGTVRGGADQRVESGFAYAAGKLSVPVRDNVDLYGKFGGAYRYLDLKGSVSRDGHYWAPVYALGAEYSFRECWKAGFQWTYLTGHFTTRDVVDQAPVANLFTVFGAYQFAT